MRKILLILFFVIFSAKAETGAVEKGDDTKITNLAKSLMLENRWNLTCGNSNNPRELFLYSQKYFTGNLLSVFAAMCHVGPASSNIIGEINSDFVDGCVPVNDGKPCYDDYTTKLPIINKNKARIKIYYNIDSKPRNNAGFFTELYLVKQSSEWRIEDMEVSFDSPDAHKFENDSYGYKSLKTLVFKPGKQ